MGAQLASVAVVARTVAQLWKKPIIGREDVASLDHVDFYQQGRVADPDTDNFVGSGFKHCCSDLELYPNLVVAWFEI